MKPLPKLEVNTDYLRSHAVLDGIGHTPLLKLEALSDEVAPVSIYGKAEWYNPGGSVKDRAALNMIRAGLDSGDLTPDKTLIDATSGNTGIAYAMIGALLGLKVQLVVPDNLSESRKRILSAYGAALTFTDAQEGIDGAIVEARRLHESDPSTYFYPDQYSNPANVHAHYTTTAEEILAQTPGHLTHFVAGLGTSGTFMGCASRFREVDPSIRLISCQPDTPYAPAKPCRKSPRRMACR